MNKRVVPHNLEAEEALLGACLLSRDAIEAVRRIVTPSDFYKPQHRTVFERMLTLTDAGEPADVITVSDVFESHERQHILEQLHGMQNATPAISTAPTYANQILHASKLRALIYVGSDLVESGYSLTETPAEVATSFSRMLADHELLRRHQGGAIVGYYDDIAVIDPGEDRDVAQPWIARGVLRRGQRLLVVAKAGIGKSTFLRQLAFCAVNGVHPLTEQATERKRRALVVELEAGLWDISSSMRDILLALRRAKQVHTAFDLERPALLHRPGGLDIRSPDGLATLELAIQRAQPDLVVMGPVKYCFGIKPGENYESAALAVHGILNELMARYGFALAMEAHFSRGEYGAPGGSERWVDWPDVGFGIHPPEDCPTPPPPATDMEVRQFRNPRDGGIYFPPVIVRGIRGHLPWLAIDGPDPYRIALSMFSERYGGVREADYVAYEQTGLPALPETDYS